MKKGIDVWVEYDKQSIWTLLIGKKKGKLSLDDIREAAMQWDEDIYCLPIVAMTGMDDAEFGFSVPNSDGTRTHYDDLVQLYRVDDVWRKGQ